MARYDVFQNPGESRRSTPYLLEAQCDLLEDLDTRVVIPMRPIESLRGIELPKQLTPIISFLDHEYVLETPKMAAVPKRILKTPVGSLSNSRDKITAAIDFLFHGF